MYTGAEAKTVFNRAAVFRRNTGGRTGGALHTAGLTIMKGGGIFTRNNALVRQMFL